MNRASVMAALAGALIFGSALSKGSDISEAALMPRDAFELSTQEIAHALRVADAGWDDTQFEALDELSNIGGTAVPYSRPDRRRFSVCDGCEFNIGFGTTYHSFEGTGGEVIPVTMTWDRGRWEVGVFHFSEQTSSDNAENVELLVAKPYWAASMSRRFKFYERGPLRAIFGFGLSYRTETDVLSATHWNFSSQLGLRFESPNFPAIFELSARHWSNGGVKTPNRGQDFTILSVRFDR